ncbi:hypothetical protein F2P81_011051 [Scophthalmus maximus]|uniref:Uncharacterized protein n=1 Tax=Scophthalmus maximus TaxID=52904 RepID=A0A6A4SSS9_SCOMX|nr:hypothetical protein F2P81_011051 [Scophthalmus maximus]
MCRNGRRVGRRSARQTPVPRRSRRAPETFVRLVAVFPFVPAQIVLVRNDQAIISIRILNGNSLSPYLCNPRLQRRNIFEQLSEQRFRRRVMETRCREQRGIYDEYDAMKRKVLHRCSRSNP